MTKSSCILPAIGISLAALVAGANSDRAQIIQPRPESEIDVETILEKVRQSQRPTDNMRIEWVSEAGPGGAYFGVLPPPEKRILLTKYTGSAVVSGIRSRIEERQETYYAKDSKQPGHVRDQTYVFDGAARRRFEQILKGSNRSSKRGFIRLDDGNPHLLRLRLFGGDNPPIHNEERLKEYEFTLGKSRVSGVFILEAIQPSGWRYRLTIDGNRGYNIIKRETLRSDGSVDYQDNFRLEQYSGRIWFTRGGERIRFYKKKSKSELEQKIEVTAVGFDTAAPRDDTFKLSFPEGTRIWDSTFYYGNDGFPVGCLSQRRHTEEDSAVTAILEGFTEKQKPTGQDEVFGRMKVRTISSIENRKSCFIDLETGATFSIPPDFHLRNRRAQKFWLEENGIDGRVETDEGLRGLWTFHTVVIPLSNDRWDSITPAAIHRVFQKLDGIYPPIMSAEGKLPATFLFQTWDSRGILQILQAQKDTKPRFLKVRYKMIKETGRS